MATTKVRGITIELGADTSGLNKALTDVNKEIGSTQKELKDVEKLLKMDPGNTELLAQKQRLLADRVSETKDKLEILKKTEAELEQAYQNGDIDKGQFDALQREIISCENELKNLEKAAGESNVALQKISDAGGKLQDVGGKLSSVGSSVTKNVTLPILGITTAAIKTTADFDKEMAKVKAISGATGEEFDALRDKARELGEKTKFSAQDAASAMEFMSMAGWKTEDMLEGIEGIMNLAAASGEDLATTSDIVTDALTAFGMSAEDSTKFADILAATAANANTNVSMMGETFKYAAPVMGAMGYSAEDAALAIGLMGNAGIKASNAGTTLRGLISRMADPTDEVAMAMDRLGVSLYDDEGNMYSFYEIMEQLRSGMGSINMPVEEFEKEMAELNKQLEDGTLTQAKYDKATDELILRAYGAEEAEKARAASMLAGKNALSGLLAITNASDEDFYKLKEAIDGSGGAAQNMADIMQDSAAGQVEILMSQLQELAISLGETLIPMFREVVGHIQGVVDWFNNLSDTQKDMIVKVGLLVAAVGPLLSAIGNMSTGLGAVMKVAPKLAPVFSALGSAIGFLTSPIGLVIAAVVGLVALIATKGDEIKALIQKVDDWLQKIFQKDWTEVFGSLGEVFNAFFRNIKNIWDSIKKIFDGIIDFIRGVFTGDWSRAWEGIKKIFSGVFDGLLAIAKAPINGIIAILNGLIDGINFIIKGLNKISFSIPDWVPGIGGKKFGINIGQVGKIPYLAKGGTFDDGTAIVGEAGAELLTLSNGVANVQPLTTGGNSSHTDITDLLETYLPYLAEGSQIVLDTGILVGATAPEMNDALGRIAMRAGSR